MFTSSQMEYEKLKNIWLQNNYQFHTYTDKNVKKKTFVIKGLHKDTEIEDLTSELQASNYTVSNINLMKNTKQPMFMVTLTTNVQLKQIRQNVCYLGNTKIEKLHKLHKQEKNYTMLQMSGMGTCNKQLLRQTSLPKMCWRTSHT